MKEINGNDTEREGHHGSKGPQLGMAIAVLIAGVVLAILSLVEFAFPKVKWFTTPAMGVLIIFLVAAALLRRMTWFIRFTGWVLSSLRGTRSKKDPLGSLGLPE